MNDFSRFFFRLFARSLCLAFCCASAAPAFDSPAAAREAFEKGDDAAKRACVAYVVEQVLASPPRNVWEPVKTLVAMQAERGEIPAFVERAASAVSSKTPEWGEHFAAAAAESLADLGRFDEALSVLENVIADSDRHSDAQRVSAVSRAASILDRKKDAPREAAAFLRGKIASAFGASKPVPFSQLANQLADLLRARTGEPAEAETLWREVLSLGASAPDREAAAAAEKLGEQASARGESREAAAFVLSALSRSPLDRGSVAAKLVACGATPDELENAVAVLSRRMAPFPSDPVEFRSRAERIQPETVTLLLALGRTGEALAEARTQLWQVSDREYPAAVERLARVLKAADGNLGRANAWLAFQGSGSAGDPDRKAGRILFSAPPASDPVRAAAAGDIPPAPGDWTALLAASRYLLWLDRPADAVETAAKAFAVCPLRENELALCAATAVRPLLVATRDETLAGALVDWFLFGREGPDGEAGTADDLADPMPSVREALSFPADSPPEG